METEGGLLGRWNPGLLPVGLFGLSLLFGLLGFSVGWFSVDTKVEIWEYDPNAPDGKGEPGIPYGGGARLERVRIDTEMRMGSLGTRITPDDLHDFIEETEGLPTYSEHMGQTGTSMIGVTMLHTVSLVGLLATVGLYAWTRKSQTRSFGPFVWRFAAVFGAFALLSLLYLALAVPPAAEQDTNDVLSQYSFYLESQGFPPVDPALLKPDVRFWNTWTCCPPDSHFPRGGSEYLVVVTTQSRPSAGFWLEALSLISATGALALATNAGQLDEKSGSPARASSATSSTSPPPSAPKLN